MIPTVEHLSYAFFVLILPKYADIYGRRLIYSVAIVMAFILYVLVFFMPNATMMIILMFFFGICFAMLYTIGYVNLFESVPKKYVALVGACFGVWDFSTPLLTSLYFVYISKDWVYLGMFGCGLQFLSMISLFLVQESPYFMISLNRFDQLSKHFGEVARRNGVDSFDVSPDQIRELKQDSKPNKETPPTMYFLRQRKILINTIVMMCIWAVNAFNFNLMSFLVTTFKYQFASAIASSTADILSQVIASILFTVIALKKNYIGSYALSSLAGLGLLVWGIEHQDTYTFLVLILFAKFGISLSCMLEYNGHTTVFPTLYASTALGFCQFMSRFLSSFPSFVADMDEPVPMIVFFTSTLFVFFASFFLQVDQANLNP